jgi:hypothetical protein
MTRKERNRERLLVALLLLTVGAAITAEITGAQGARVAFWSLLYLTGGAAVYEVQHLIRRAR